MGQGKAQAAGLALLLIACAPTAADFPDVSVCPDCCPLPLYDIEQIGHAVSCPPDRGTCFTDDGVERPCICRGADECGAGFQCTRGPGCYCTCSLQGEPPNPQCPSDPLCEDVRVSRPGEPSPN